MITFSIICPFYNSERFLAETIDSVLNQTFLDWELILIDDCSKDNGAKICKNIQSRDDRVRVFSNNHNEGPYNTRLTGISLSSGEYILFLDSDDKLLPGALAVLSALVEEHCPDVIMFEYVRNEKKLFDNVSVLDNKSNEIINCSNDILKKVFVEKQSLNLWSKCYKRELFNNHFEKRIIRYSEDTLLLFKALINANGMLIIDKPLLYYRDNQSSITHQLSLKDALDCWETNNIVFDELVKRNVLKADSVTQGFVSNMFWSLFMCIWLASKKEQNSVYQLLKKGLLFDYLKKQKVPKVNFTYSFVLKKYMKGQYFVINTYKKLYHMLRPRK